MPARKGAAAARWCAAALLTCAPGVPQAAVADTRAMTFEEALRDGRSFGQLAFSPSGQQVLASVERAAPGRGLPTGLTGTATFVWDLASGHRRQIQAGSGRFTPAPCEPWSASSRYIAGFSPTGDRRRMTVWSVDSGRSVAFHDAPTTSCPTWTGDSLVYAVGAPSLPSAGSSNTRRLGYLLGRWRRAGKGGSAIVTSHSANPAFPSPQPPDGALVLGDPLTGRSHRIATGTFHSITASPDARHVAAVRLLEADPCALFSGRRGELSIYSLSPRGGQLVYRLQGIDPDYAGLSWSPDGQRLLVAGRSLPDRALTLTVIDVPRLTGRRIAIPAGVRLGEGLRGAYSAFRPVGWIDGRPAFIAAKAASLPTPSNGHTDYGEGEHLSFGLFWEDAAGVRELTAFARQSVTAFAASPRGDGFVVTEGALWAVGAGGSSRVSPQGLEVTSLAPARPTLGLPPLFAVAPDHVLVTARSPGGATSRVTLDTATGRVVSSAPADGVAAFSPSLEATARVRRSGWTQALTIVGRHAQTLMTLNAAWRSRPVAEVRPLDYAIEGRRLRAWIILPPGRHGALPAIVWVYGGQNLQLGPPEDALPGATITPVFSGQLWASRGYAVLYPSLPFEAGSTTDVADTLAKETLGAIDAAADQGLVDRERVGIVGHSFGGFATAAVLSKHSDRFRAGIAMSGAFDFSAGWAARAFGDELVDQDSYAFAAETRGYVEHGQIGLGGPPWEDVGSYVRASPFFAATRIKTPLLLTVGDLDLGSTSLLQSERMYAALLRTGNPAVLVRYWGEGHVQSEPAVAKDQWRRFCAWFDHYLRRADGP